MTGAVVAILIGALFGLAIVLLSLESIPFWRQKSRTFEAGVAYQQGLPKEDEQ